jgi:hypothetical protein
MITEEMLTFWKRHRKHPDILDRGSAEERAVLTVEQWTLLEELAAGLRLAEQGVTSAEFQCRIEDQLQLEVSPAASELLRQVSRQ